MNLRPRICYALSVLRIHRPDCEHCGAREMCGDELRKRLEQLNWRTQPRPLNHGDHGKVVEVSDSTPGVVAEIPPVSLEQPKKIA